MFAGSKRELEQLDALCVELWRATTRVVNPIGMTRVRSAGRVHPWPGDPDDIASVLMERGFSCPLEQSQPRGETLRETIVVVTGRL